LSSDAFSGLTTVANKKVLYFKNQTNLATTKISVKQIGTLDITNALKDNIQVAFADGSSAGSPTTTYYTLQELTDDSDNIPAAVGANSSEQHAVSMFVKLKEGALNTLPTSLGGMQFDFGPVY